MYQYVIINYTDRSDDDNEIIVKHITDNLEYAKKLAFHYAKKELPAKSLYSRTECRIIESYRECKPISITNEIVVEYRICEVIYNDKCGEYEIDDVWCNVWTVVKIHNESETVEDIDKKLIFEY